MVMTADVVRGDIRLPVEPDFPTEGDSVAWRFFTFMAIRQGARWSSLCLELGISSVGDSADEAIARLREVVSDALEHEYADGVEAEHRVTEAELDEWLAGHEGAEAIVASVEPLRVTDQPAI